MKNIRSKKGESRSYTNDTKMPCCEHLPARPRPLNELTPSETSQAPSLSWPPPSEGTMGSQGSLLYVALA